jgi:sirohydrochlorin ferrochelatase
VTGFPTLVAVAHGTKNINGLAELRRLTNIVRTKLPGVPVELCFVDVVSPRLVETLAEVRGPAVVVPLLLATGYHVKVDIPAAVGDRAQTVVSDPIGPDERVSRAVQQRLDQAQAAFRDPDEPEDEDQGARPGEVILVGAGSSDREARKQLAEVAGHLRAWNQCRVTIAQLSDDDPFAKVSNTVQVANYLLAPGHFDTLLRNQTAGHVVGAPIGAHPLVAEVIIDRYRSGVERLSEV